MRWSEQDYEAYQIRRSGAAPKVETVTAQSAPIRQSRKQPNKTERRFELEYLELWRRERAIDSYQFEAITLKLANGVRYTPDYLVSAIGKTAKIFEVKGGFIREDAKIKLKVAAAEFSQFEFYLAQYSKGEWTINRVLP